MGVDYEAETRCGSTSKMEVDKCSDTAISYVEKQLYGGAITCLVPVNNFDAR